MVKSFQTIGIIGKYQSPEGADMVLQVAAFVHQENCKVLIEQSTANAIGLSSGEYTVASYDVIGEQCDLAIVVGGDGSLLLSARRLAEHAVPLAGINLGRLGFLTDIGRDEALEKIGAIINGRFTREPRFLLSGEVMRAEERVLHTLALNDIVIDRGGLGSMIEFDVLVNDEFAYTQRSDGCILSTPTGSTAYALSANGPIMHPAVDAIALVPLCPHSLTVRPIVLPARSRIGIRLLSPHDARVRFDGHTSFDARAGDCVYVTQWPQMVELIHPGDYSYYAMLREKLHWSVAPRLAR